MRGKLPSSAVARAAVTAKVARVHRTTTATATLLVTMAFSALAGCVTLQRPPAPGPAVAASPPSPPSVPRPEGRPRTQVVQAPAREALALVGPSPKPRPTVPAQRRQPATAQEPSSRSRPHHPRPAPTEPRRGARPRVEIPDGAEARGNTDVCALGRKYGGWQRDSPEAVICGQTYGR